MGKKYLNGKVANLGFDSQVAVTKSNVTVVEYDAIYIGTGGDVAIKLNDGAAVTWTNVPAGTIIPGNVITAIMATNTDAADIIGLNYRSD